MVALYDRIGVDYRSLRRAGPRWEGHLRRGAEGCRALVSENVAALPTVVEHLQPIRVEPLPVPADCHDGFFGAYWKRPEAYLDPVVRRAISALALLDEATVRAAMETLRDDLASGRWQARYPELADRSELDLGYRLVVAEG